MKTMRTPLVNNIFAYHIYSLPNGIVNILIYCFTGTGQDTAVCDPALDSSGKMHIAVTHRG